MVRKISWRRTISLMLACNASGFDEAAVCAPEDRRIELIQEPQSSLLEGHREHQSSVRRSERRISGALSSVAGRATHESFLVGESTIPLLDFKVKAVVIHPLAVSK